MLSASEYPWQVSDQVLIAGAGIGGVACALACTRVGLSVALYEKAEQLSEVGAGIQLGPNAMRLLQAWDVTPHLSEAIAYPQRLVVRSGTSGRALAQMELGSGMVARYGAPYGVVHRADLHRALLQALARAGGAEPRLGQALEDFRQSDRGVDLRFANHTQANGLALIGADGIGSRVRQVLLSDGPARPTGHLAYRTLISQADLPARLRCDEVVVWLAPGMHVVQYPVRQGQCLNLVVIVQEQLNADVFDWDRSGTANDVQRHLHDQCTHLRDLAGTASQWGLWSLRVRKPLSSPGELVQGRVALVGDAAHPMLPYLAQGASMAMEDAQALASSLQRACQSGLGEAAGLQAYAIERWARQSRVQKRSLRNGRIFHARGPVSWGRNLALRVLGQRLLDMPWLYGQS